MSLTINAAYNDKRFNKITKGEIDNNDLNFKITFLEKPFRLLQDEDFILGPGPSETWLHMLKAGQHGIIAYFNDNKSATFLASVVKTLVEQNIDIINELRNKCESKGQLSYVELYVCHSSK